MPVQQVEPGKVQLAACHPPDTSPQRQHNSQQRQQAQGRATVPTPEMDQARPHAPQLAPQQQQQPETSSSMQRKNEPISQVPANQTDKPSQQSESSSERKAPIGQARRHRRPSLKIESLHNDSHHILHHGSST